MMKGLPAVALIMLGASLAQGGTHRVAEDGSTFAVVTHKAGLGKGLAHNHLVVASAYDANVRFDPAAPMRTSLEFSTATSDLVADDAELRAAWYPRLEQLSILDQPFGSLSDKNREKIRRSMLAAGQLDAEGHPRIEAKIAGIRKEPARHGDTEFACVADLTLVVRGTSVTRPVAARHFEEDGRTIIEAFGIFHFTDFGIKPYSAFLGAVRNRDDFHVYTRLTLVPLE